MSAAPMSSARAGARIAGSSSASSPEAATPASTLEARLTGMQKEFSRRSSSTSDPKMPVPCEHTPATIATQPSGPRRKSPKPSRSAPAWDPRPERAHRHSTASTAGAQTSCSSTKKRRLSPPRSVFAAWLITRRRRKYAPVYSARHTTAGVERVSEPRARKAPASAAKLSPRATHARPRTRRRERRSTIGARASTRPRMSSIIRTMDVPSKVYASVVETVIVAAQSPDSADQRVGTGKLTPRTVRALAARHQPVPRRKAREVTRHATALPGRSAKPSTRPLIPGSAPSETALVSAP